MRLVPLAIAAVVLVVYGWLRCRQRAARVRQAAGRRNLQFHVSDPLDLTVRYRDCVLMRVGHAHCISYTLSGRHALGGWYAFLDAYDLGFGAHRIRSRRAVAVMELPLGLSLVWVPDAAATDESHPLRTAIDSMAYALVPAVDPGSKAPDTHAAATPADATGAPRSGGADTPLLGGHCLWARQSADALAPRAVALAGAASTHPADWTWEAADRAILVSAPGASEELLPTLLDAVAEAAAGVAAAGAAPRARAAV